MRLRNEGPFSCRGLRSASRNFLGPVVAVIGIAK